MSWLREHLVGASVFAPAVIILAAVAFYAWGTHRKRYLPWLLLVAWLGTVLVHYIRFDVGRLYSDARPMWAAQLLTLAVVTALPLAITILPYALPAQTTGARRTLALAGLVLGLLSILAIAPLSGAMGALLDPVVHSAQP